MNKSNESSKVEQASKNITSKEDILTLIQENKMILSILIVFLNNLLLIILGLWELMIIAAFIGGCLMYEKPRNGLITGSSGIITSWIVFLNFNLLRSLKAWNMFIETILEIGGVGWLGLILLFIIIGSIGALAGYCGASSTSLLLPEFQKRVLSKGI